jgi:drug/metabolite transporter (DMT)-like permease
MINLLLSILSFTAMLMIFKLVDRFKADTFHVIIYNYITAAALGFIMINPGMSLAEITHTKWFPNTIVIGILFISLFYILALTAQKVSISVSSVANKMSVIIPVVFAFFLYGDTINFLKITGIILALIGVVLVSKKDGFKFDKKYFLLPLILFIGSGLLDTYINYTETYYIGNDILAFVPTVFLVCAVIGLLVIISRLLVSPYKFKLKNVMWGILLGGFNYASLYFILESLKIDYLESSVVFPLNNIGIVTLSALFSFLFFKEELSKENKGGLILCVIAILMIAFS